MENRVRTFSSLNILAGIWLVISPAFIDYASTGNLWQQMILGGALIVFGLVRLGMPDRSWPSWINLAIGAWIIIAPFVISGVTDAVTWNQVITGALVVLLSLGSGQTTMMAHRHGHHAT